MFRAREVIKGVAKIAITRRRRHVSKKINARDDRRDQKRELRAFYPASCGSVRHGEKQYQSKQHLRVAINKKPDGFIAIQLFLKFGNPQRT
jgi:hypothetical protein